MHDILTYYNNAPHQSLAMMTGNEKVTPPTTPENGEIEEQIIRWVHSKK